MSVAARISSIPTTIKPQSHISSSPRRNPPSPPSQNPHQPCLLTLFQSSFLNPIRITPLTTTKSLTRKTPTIQMSMEAGIGLMGTKLGMMTCFESTGTVVPVTVIGFREGYIVTLLKTQDTDGYNAVQVGYRKVRDKKLTKPELGHLEKAGCNTRLRRHDVLSFWPRLLPLTVNTQHLPTPQPSYRVLHRDYSIKASSRV